DAGNREWGKGNGESEGRQAGSKAKRTKVSGYRRLQHNDDGTHKNVGSRRVEGGRNQLFRFPIPDSRFPALTREDKDMAHFELVEKMAPNAVIKVIGVGGGGGNAVAHMVNSSVDGVEFITANTDSQAIRNCGAKLQLQLGGNVTKGLGAGANPEVGR